MRNGEDARLDRWASSDRGKVGRPERRILGELHDRLVEEEARTEKGRRPRRAPTRAPSVTVPALAGDQNTALGAWQLSLVVPPTSLVQGTVAFAPV